MIKRIFFTIMLLFFIISLILFSSSNLQAAQNGLILWATSVVPSLFPFFVATELLALTNALQILSSIFNKFMKPIFNINGEGAFAIIMGLICGYPIGAKIVCDFRKNNILSKTECERLLSFTNNSNPIFIMGTVGIGMYGSSLIGFLLLITHILASFTVGFLFRFWKNINFDVNKSYVNTHKKRRISLSNIGEILSNSIYTSIKTLLMIGGFVVLFSVIISIIKTSHLLNIFTIIISPIFKLLHIPPLFTPSFFTGILEITNGIAIISNIQIKAISINIILTSFLLGMGGISIFLQIISIVSKTDLSIKPYIIGKLLQGILAVFYTFIFIKIFPIFNLNL